MDSTSPGRLSVGWWLAIIVVVLTTGAVGMALIAYRNVFAGNFMFVIVPTPVGRLTFGERGVSLDRALKFHENGMRDLQTNVERLLKSSKELATLDVFVDSSEVNGFSLVKRKDQLEALFLFDQPGQSTLEADVREISESFDVQLNLVKSDPRRGVPGYTMLVYHLAGDASETSEVLSKVLRDAYGVAPDGGLYVRFAERKLE